jgi:hypothetical protein
MASAQVPFVAAALWFMSAMGDLPLLSAYWDSVPPGDPFVAAMQRSAHLNEYASNRRWTFGGTRWAGVSC